MQNIIETAASQPNLKIFIKAVMETGLYDYLREEGPFTIFTPTDAAFEKLPPKTIEQLFQDKEKLTDLLAQHIILEKMSLKNTSEGKQINMANGKILTLSGKNGLSLDKANVIKKDIICANGIMHTINEVLLVQT